MSGNGGRRALSCAGQLEHALRGALSRARPAIDLSAAGQQQLKLKLPTHLGVRRSAQPNADYQTSLPLMLGNRLREPPVKFAQDLVDQLYTTTGSNSTTSAASALLPQPQLVRDAFVSTNGFVNLVLDDAWVAQHVVHMATTGVQPTPALSAPDARRILVDFAAPNLGKKLHVGHLRSSVIGDTICNLLEFRGHHVTRVSHTGDVGAALATLLVELMEQCVPLETLTDAQLGQHYEAGKRRAMHDAAFKARVNDVVIQLQHIGVDTSTSSNSSSSSDADSTKTIEPRVLATWERACQVSRDAYAAIFERLNVNVSERGESTYLSLITSTLSNLQARGLVVPSRGALCIFVDGPDKPPMLVQKQDGGFLYATIDLACLFSRIFGLPGVDDTRYDELVYITDASQERHFQHLFAAAKLAGWTSNGDNEAQQEGRHVTLTHASFGLVLGADGTKLSSRNGAFDYLEDLLDEAARECSRRALASISSGASSASSVSDTDTDALNRKLGDAAVRYFELSQQRERNYKFAFDNVLQLKGNTGVYLLYATARLHGILRNAVAAGAVQTDATDWSSVLGTTNNNKTADAIAELTLASRDWHASERALALLLCQFDDEVAATLVHLAPHSLCDYLFRVVAHFHAFYEHCRVVGAKEQTSRLLLCAATDAVLRRGLQLVGVEPVQRM